MLKQEKRKAQSTLEYILILTAVVGVIIYAAATWIMPAIEDALNAANTGIGGAGGRLP